MAKPTNLIVDLSNLVYASYFATMKDTNGEFSQSLIIQKILNDILFSVEKFSASGLLIACDGRKNWRRDELYPEYKGKREEHEHKAQMIEVMEDLMTFFRESTNIPTLNVEGAEADDIIAFATKMSTQKSVIISSDKDFVQLLNDRVRLYAPSLKLERISDNPKYDLFIKCIRGDSGDNIFSAYPRVRETRLKKAWDDGLEMVNLMGHILKDGKTVKENFEFNRELIDLSRQPDHIKESVVEAINNIASNGQSFKFVQVVRFLGKYKLVNVKNNMGRHSRVFKMTFKL